MVGAIVVTLETDDLNQKFVKRQDLVDQATQTNKNMIYFSLQNLKTNSNKVRSELYIKLWKNFVKDKKSKFSIKFY